MKRRLGRIVLYVMLFCFWRLGTAQADDAREYRVEVDDVLEINILKPEQLNTTVSVSPGGSISMVYLGDVKVQGMTLGEIQNEIQNRLADGYMNYPLVSVYVKESRSRKFFVYGGVARPGSYAMDHATTVLKAISIAGGFSKNSSSSTVQILRPSSSGSGYEHINVDMTAVMKGDTNADIMLKPGDTVIISEGNFSVYGDVMKPGVFPLEENTTLLKAVSMAGGLSRQGAASLIKVIRVDENGASKEAIATDMFAVTQGRAGADFKLKTGDSIIVTEQKFFVYGDVAKPGVFAFEENTTLLKAISMAGGLSRQGTSSVIKVLRADKDGSTREAITTDMLAVTQSKAGVDFKLMSGDSVIVTEQKFFVYGEVNKPGVYSVEGNTTVLKAISIAGGFTKYGSTSRVKILRPTNDGWSYETIKINIKDIMDGISSADVPLRSGDTVVVAEGMF